MAARPHDPEGSILGLRYHVKGRSGSFPLLGLQKPLQSYVVHMCTQTMSECHDLT